ncbi:NS3 protein [Wanken orbivirus]|nr:NS3 protein [Wanken orbivirus]
MLARALEQHGISDGMLRKNEEKWTAQGLGTIHITPEAVERLMEIKATAPPEYVETEEMIEKQEAKDKDTSFRILTNAVASGTEASEIQKREKAAYGAAAEALRDDEMTRRIKVIVNRRAILEIEGHLTKKKWTGRFVGLLVIFFATVSVVTSFIQTLTSASSVIDGYLQKGGLSINIVNLSSTVAMIALSRVANKLSAASTQLRRDLTKKKTYVQVAGGGHQTTFQNPITKAYRPSNPQCV